jgi:predicted transcriptional regulator
MGNERVLIEMDAKAFKNIYDTVELLDSYSLYIYKKLGSIEFEAHDASVAQLIMIIPRSRYINAESIENAIEIKAAMLEEAMKNFKAKEGDTISIIEKKEGEEKNAFIVFKNNEKWIGKVTDSEKPPLSEPQLQQEAYAVISSDLLNLGIKLKTIHAFDKLTIIAKNKGGTPIFKLIFTNSADPLFYLEISSTEYINKFIEMEYTASGNEIFTTINLDSFNRHKHSLPPAFNKKFIHVKLANVIDYPVVLEAETDYFSYTHYIAPDAQGTVFHESPLFDVEYKFSSDIAEQFFAMLKGMASRESELLLTAGTSVEFRGIDAAHVFASKIAVNKVEKIEGSLPPKTYELAVDNDLVALASNIGVELADAGLTPKLGIGKFTYFCGVNLGETEELKSDAEKLDYLKTLDSVVEKLKRENCEKGKTKCISISGSDFIKASGSEYLKLAYLKPLNKVVVKADGKEIANEKNITNRTDICPKPHMSVIQVIRSDLLFPPFSSKAIGSLPVNICFTFGKPTIITFDVEPKHSGTKLLSFFFIVAPPDDGTVTRIALDEGWITHANEEDVISALAESGGIMYEDELEDAILAELKDPLDVPELIKSLEEKGVVKTEKEGEREKITLLKMTKQISDEEKRLKLVETIVAQIEETINNLKGLMEEAQRRLDFFNKEAEEAMDMEVTIVEEYDKYVNDFLKEAERVHYKRLKSIVEDIKSKKAFCRDLIFKARNESPWLPKNERGKELEDRIYKLNDELNKIEDDKFLEEYEKIKQKLLDSVEKWKALKEESSKYPSATEDDVISAIKESGGRISGKDLIEALAKKNKNPSNIEDLIYELIGKGLVYIERSDGRRIIVLIEEPSAQPQAPPAPQPKPPEAKPSPPPPKPPEAKPPSPPTPPPKPPEGTDEASKLIESARTKVKEWVGLYVPKARAQAVLDSFENMVKDERASIEALLRAGKKEQAQDVIKSILEYIAKIIISISTRAKQNPEIAKYAGVTTEEAIAEVPEIYKPKEEEERIGFRPKEEERGFPGYPSFAKWWESRMSFISRAYGAGAIPPINPQHPNPYLGMFPIFVSKRNGIIELSGTTFSGLRKILEQAGIKIEYRASFTREELVTLIESAYDQVSKDAKEWLDELKSKL